MSRIEWRRRSWISGGSRSPDDLRHAVRDLADALERLRADVKVVLDKDDEKALFNIANNFGIRHLNDTQRHDYAQGPFLRWLFYVSLATVHLTVRVAGRPSGERGLAVQDGDVDGSDEK